MGKYQYSDEEQKSVNVLKYQDDQLKNLKDDAQARNEQISTEIDFLESQLKDLGIDPKSAKPYFHENNKRKIMVLPSWEKLCAEAELAVGNQCELESIFSQSELESNEKAICQLREEYSQIHRLDKTDVAISAIAAIIGAAVDILLVGIPKKGPDGLEAAPLSDFIRKKFDEAFPEDEMEKLANSKESKVPFDAQDNRNTTIPVEGLSAYYHRLLSLGHDPLTFLPVE